MHQIPSEHAHSESNLNGLLHSMSGFLMPLSMMIQQKKIIIFVEQELLEAIASYAPSSYLNSSIIGA